MAFRFSFALDIITTCSSLLVFFLIDRYQGILFGPRLGELTARLGTSYFGYVAVGLAVSELANAGLDGVVNDFRRERAQGTLAYLLGKGVSIHKWAAVSGLVHFARSLFRFLLILLLVIFAFRFTIPSFSAVSAFTILLLAAPGLWALSVISMAGTIFFRRGNPVGFVLGLVFEILGGVYVPPEALPGFLPEVARLLPMGLAVEAMQKVVYGGAGLWELSPLLTRLCWINGIFMAMAWVLLEMADRFARRRGLYCLN
ncbi:MAG TPA: ABC transporter permease [Bdellovibrionota bacterium]